MTRQALETRLHEGIAAALLVERGRAQQLLRDVVAADPQNAEAWLWLAAAAATTDQAIDCLRRVIETWPDHPYARAALGKALLRQALALAGGDPAAARSLLAEAADLLPAGDEMKRLAWNRLVARGVTLVKLGQRAEAREVFEHASVLIPDARVWFALAQLAVTPASAVDPLRRAVRLDPSHQRARLALAALLADMAASAHAAGDRGQARSLLIEACALDSSNVDNWIARGRAEEGDDVIACVERIRELSPEHPAVTDLVSLCSGRDEASRRR